ncbi:MAG: DMT family transporter [Oscillospiraceae bacterium]|nr:DMT family transporter [Oscillospiraceae bacterium]
MWLFWCLLSTFVSGFIAIAIKKCSNNEPKRVALLGMLFYHFFMILIALIINPSFITKLNIIDIGKLVPGIALQSLGFYCWIASLKYGKVAITSSIQKASVVITFLLGVILLRENSTVLQLFISIILIVLTIILASNRENGDNVDKKSEIKAILYSFGFVLFFGVSGFVNKLYIDYYKDPMYVLFNYAVIMFFGILMYCLFTKKWDLIDIRKINSKKYFILQSVLDVSSVIFLSLALVDGNVSTVSVIGTSSIIITILASRFMLKEKISWKKYLIISAVFICVLILSVT